MATIDDFGGTTDPLNAPPLGGPTGWAAAVRDYLKDLLATKVAKAGDVMTGELTLPGAPTAALHAATKGYVDGRVVGGNALITPDSSGVVAIPHGLGVKPRGVSISGACSPGEQRQYHLHYNQGQGADATNIYALCQSTPGVAQTGPVMLWWTAVV